jgi:hypothetical protein
LSTVQTKARQGKTTTQDPLSHMLEMPCRSRLVSLCVLSLLIHSVVAVGGTCDIKNSVFNAGDQLNEKKTMVALLGLVIFTVCFELALHLLEHNLRHQPNYLVILGKIYKELMILGFISFILFVLIQTCVLQVRLPSAPHPLHPTLPHHPTPHPPTHPPHLTLTLTLTLTLLSLTP